MRGRIDDEDGGVGREGVREGSDGRQSVRGELVKSSFDTILVDLKFGFHASSKFR